REATLATLVRDGEITRINLDSGEALSSTFELLQSRGQHARMVAAFDQIARLTRDEFYRDDMNGVDWNGYVATYRRLLADINNDRD
ncbi:hypothetical protein, partial [Aeromonas hydrophila]|uniref:hypothetical protein n=1 Tax=Aeromonas hydrophila TaxID=644 RepID=UPI0036DCCC9A